MSALEKPNLQGLRLLIGAIENPNGRETFAFDQVPRGIPRGAIVEFAGFGKTTAVTQLLLQHKDKQVAWIEKTISVFPTALSQQGLNLDRILFIEAKDQHQWVLQQVLQSQQFAFIVVSFISFAENELRKLQLLAEKSKTSVLLLSENLHQAWPITMQIQISRKEDVLLTDIIKQRW